jgi:hypothetical protein
MPRRPAAFDEQRTGVVCRLRSYCCVGSGFIQSGKLWFNQDSKSG